MRLRLWVSDSFLRRLFLGACLLVAMVLSSRYVSAWAWLPALGLSSAPAAYARIVPHGVAAISEPRQRRS